MSGQRISGKSFTTTIMGKKIHVESATLTITDNTAVAKNGGVPAGFIQGDVEAAGEIVLDISQVAILTAAAAVAGSWQGLEPIPLHFFATGGGTVTENMAIFADGCKLSISELLNIDPTSTDKSTVTLPYIVTGDGFVKINGVPYVDSSGFGLI